jgi:hypothetical protein
MSFLKIHLHYVNIDHIIDVEDIGKEWLVRYRSYRNEPIELHITKGTDEEAKLIAAMSERT